MIEEFNECEKVRELAEEYYYKTYPVTLNIGEEERKKKVMDIFLAGYNQGNKIEELEKENKRLTELLNRSNVRLAEEQLKDAELEKEKCELLGLIQEKDEQIEMMKCCANCEHNNRVYGLCNFSLGDEDYHCRLRKWELAE